MSLSLFAANSPHYYDAYFPILVSSIPGKHEFSRDKNHHADLFGKSNSIS